MKLVYKVPRGRRRGGRPGVPAGPVARDRRGEEAMISSVISCNGTSATAL